MQKLFTSSFWSKSISGGRHVDAHDPPAILAPPSPHRDELVEDVAEPSTSVKLPIIPPELIYHIIHLSIEDHPPTFDLRNQARTSALTTFALVSKDWRVEAQRELFRHVVLSRNEQAHKFMKVLVEDETDQLSEMVESLRIGSLVWRVEEVEGMILRSQIQRFEWTGLGDLVQKLTKLEDLRLAMVVHADLTLDDLYEAQNLKSLHLIHSNLLAFRPSARVLLPKLEHLTTLQLSPSTLFPQTFCPSSLFDKNYLVAPKLSAFLSPFDNQFDATYTSPARFSQYFAPFISRGLWTAEKPLAVLSSDGESDFDPGVRKIFKVLSIDHFKTALLARDAWKSFSVLCVQGYEGPLSSFLKEIAEQLDMVLPISKEVALGGDYKLVEIRVPNFETKQVKDVIEYLRKVCGREDRDVKVVADKDLCQKAHGGELYDRRTLEEQAGMRWFWNAVRSLESRSL